MKRAGWGQEPFAGKKGTGAFFAFRVGLLATIALLSELIAGKACGQQGVPGPEETPVEVIVSGRTSTLKSIRIVEVGQNIPKTFAGGNVKNTEGFRWYVSRHYALKSNVDDKFSRHILTIAELAYPHYRWVMGREPEGIETTRMALVYAKNLDGLQRSVRDDINSFWAGSGGGVTLRHKVAYNYPSGTLMYHKRDLAMHENLHLYQMCLTGAINTPGRFTEGITHAFANHVYDEQKKQLTVMVLDKATTNNPYDRALRELDKEFITMEDFVERGAGSRATWALYTQFFWDDPDRLMKWRIWRDELLRQNLQGEPLKELDLRLIKELFGSIDQLNNQWEKWIARRRNTFHYVAWGWEQSGNTLWSYGFGPQRYSRTDIQFAPNEEVQYDHLRMDYPSQPMPTTVGPVKRGVDQPSVGCLVDFSRCPGRGVAGFGLGVEGDKLAAVLLHEGRELIVDGSDLGMPKKVFPFPEYLKTAMAAHGHRAGLTMKIATAALEVTVRAGKDGAVKEMKVSVPLEKAQREKLISRHMAVLAMHGWHGVTPFIDDARRRPPDLTAAAPMGRWRFAGEDQLYRLYSAAWRLGEDTPELLTHLKEQLAEAADKDPATQQVAMDLYRRRIDEVVRAVAGLPKSENTKLALKELRAHRD